LLGAESCPDIGCIPYAFDCHGANTYGVCGSYFDQSPCEAPK
jgi:hypothetical protein